MLVQHNEQFKIFDWENVPSVSWLPEIFYQDITKDGENEIVIVLWTGTGTGISHQKIHALSSNKLEELPIIDPLEIIDEKVLIKEASDQVVITTNGVQTILFKKDMPSEILDSNATVYYGSIINFEIKANELYAIVPLLFSRDYIIGEFKIRYIFKDNSLQANTIEFSKAE